MLFKIEYELPVANVTEAQKRFTTGEEKWDGLKLIGPWHEAGNKGFMVVEAEDNVSIGKFCQQWVDLCDMQAVPIMTDEDAAKVLMS